MNEVTVLIYCLLVMLFILVILFRILSNSNIFSRNDKKPVIIDEYLPAYEENPPDYTIVYVQPPDYHF